MWNSERVVLTDRLEQLRNQVQALEAERVRLLAVTAGSQASAAANAAGAAAAIASARQRSGGKGTGSPGGPSLPPSDAGPSGGGHHSGVQERDAVVAALRDQVAATRMEVQVLQKSLMEQDALLSRRGEEVEAARAALAVEAQRGRERALAAQKELEDLRARHRTVDADNAAGRQVLQEQLWEVTQELESAKQALARNVSVGTGPGVTSGASVVTATVSHDGAGPPSYHALVELEQARRVGDSLRRELDQARLEASAAAADQKRRGEEERQTAQRDHERLAGDLARVTLSLEAARGEILALTQARNAQDAALRQAERDLADAGVHQEASRAAAVSAAAGLRADLAAAVENTHRLEQALASSSSRARAAEAAVEEERSGRRVDAQAHAMETQVTLLQVQIWVPSLVTEEWMQGACITSLR